MTREVNALKAVADAMLMSARSRLMMVERPMLYRGRAVRGST